MKILQFRPFKRFSDDELIDRIYGIFQNLNTGKDKDCEESMDLCDELIREAKCRKLYCTKEMLYKKIIIK